MINKIPIILDTDIGSDIDDAFALAYLLAQPECELLGITTVSGQAKKRAMLASVLCQRAHKKVPIFPGAEEPLLIEQQQPSAPQACALKNWPHKTQFPEFEAIDFLKHTIQLFPGEIVLLTIGPLTNIALLFKTYPKIPFLLKAVVSMTGVFLRQEKTLPPVEWNVKCDPHAANIVFQAPVPVHYLIGLDVTTKVYLNKEELQKKCSDISLLTPVLDFAKTWFKERETVTFHDPLAATIIFDRKICRFQKGSAEVALNPEKFLGKTLWYPGRHPSRHHLAISVDSKRFFHHYFQVYKK